MTRRNMFKSLFAFVGLAVVNPFVFKTEKKALHTNCCMVHGNHEDEYLFLTYHDKTGKVIDVKKMTPKEYHEYFSSWTCVKDLEATNV